MSIKRIHQIISLLMLRLIHRFVRNRIFYVEGVKLMIDEGVFSPIGTISSKLMARVVAKEVKKDERVLDLGTGTGLQAIIAALRGAQVVATDISEDAISCAMKNASINKVLERISFLKGDLFNPVSNMNFDLIIFNPPYIPGTPKSKVEKNWLYDEGQLIVKFLKDAKSHLKKGGRILMAYSSISNEKLLYWALARYRWRWRIVAQTLLPFERLYVLKITR